MVSSVCVALEILSILHGTRKDEIFKHTSPSLCVYTVNFETINHSIHIVYYFTIIIVQLMSISNNIERKKLSQCFENNASSISKLKQHASQWRVNTFNTSNVPFRFYTTLIKLNKIQRPPRILLARSRDVKKFTYDFKKMQRGKNLFHRLN